MVLSHDAYTGNSASFNLKAAVEREKAVQAIDVHRGYCQLNGLHTQWDALAERWHRLLCAYHFLPNLKRLRSYIR